MGQAGVRAVLPYVSQGVSYTAVMSVLICEFVVFRAKRRANNFNSPFVQCTTVVLLSRALLGRY